MAKLPAALTLIMTVKPMLRSKRMALIRSIRVASPILQLATVLLGIHGRFWIATVMAQ
jgi:hypothetical protein